jgi:hypothetical protein
VAGATFSLQWQHKPSADSAISVTDLTSNTTGAPKYNLFNLNGTYAVTPDVSFRWGVDNLFDKAPPVIGVNLNSDGLTTLRGGTYDAGNYDVLGRRYFHRSDVRLLIGSNISSLGALHAEGPFFEPSAQPAAGPAAPGTRGFRGGSVVEQRALLLLAEARRRIERVLDPQGMLPGVLPTSLPQTICPAPNVCTMCSRNGCSGTCAAWSCSISSVVYL